MATVVAALDALTSGAARFVKGAEAAGLTVARTRTAWRTVAATNDIVGAIDALQYEFGGPSIEAAGGGQRIVVVHDLRHDTRWPRLIAAVAEHRDVRAGVRSIVSCPLAGAPGYPYRALNLYSATAHAFDAASVRTIRYLVEIAETAASRVIARNEVGDLERFLASSLPDIAGRRRSPV